MSKVDFFKGLFFTVSFLFATSPGLSATGVNSGMPPAVNVVQQQEGTVTCIVTDELGPLIGANVMVKGTTMGTITDTNGRAVIPNVPDNAILVISYIGYLSREVAVNGRSTIEITLAEDNQTLDEIVVVGYGTQAKKDITGSVSVVSADALQETPVATFAEALQGKASGVYVSSTGAPGSQTSIRIRGVGSVNGSDPLIVVDGVSNVSIESVNPNDIESLQVLKDASATAIYGAQGANGVIIVTTKQGSKDQRVKVAYNGFAGIAKMANDGYDVLNGWEAMEFQAQGLVNLRDIRGVTTGLSHEQFGSLDANDQLTMPYAIKPSGLSKEQVISRFGSIENWKASYKPNGADSWTRSAYYQMLEDGYSEEEARKGTDWYNEVVQTGFVQDHQLSVMGGSDKGAYSMSVGYTNYEGTLKSSYFERYSLRANTTFNPTKYLTIGQNTNLSAMEMGGDRGEGGENSVYAKTYTMQSWVPIYNIGGDYAGSQAPLGGRDVSSVYQAHEQKNNWNRFFRGQAAIFAELKPIEGLRIRSQFSTRLNGRWSREFLPVTIMGNKEGRSSNQLTERAQWWLHWQWTNTATYTKTFNDDHTMTIVVGSEALSEDIGRELMARRKDYTFENDPNTWIINNGSVATAEAEGKMNNHTTMFGLFGRGDYSYRGKYLATVTVRRDASSKFGKNNRWGTFPSFSAGWRISDESFFESQRNWLDDLKIRAGYGTTGNSNIGAYNYAFQYATGTKYSYDITGSDTSLRDGYLIGNLGDPNAKWETNRMLNVGFDATLLNNRLTLGFDWYTRKTTDMLVPANWSALAGTADKPNINIGDMENKGVDFSIGWRDKVGDFRYDINANITMYKNKVIKLGSADIPHDTRLSAVSITTEGQPVGMFYGYQVEDVYKSVEDVMNFRDSNGNTIVPYGVADLNSLDPESFIGRYKLADVNGDGRITADDRTFIGNPHPDFTGGLNISMSYKNWDLSTYLYFSVGNDLFKHYMFYTHYGALQSNYSKDRRDNSWHPTLNPNGKYPLWATSTNEGAEAGNQSNSMYIEDGSYMRMQTLTVGYSLPKSVLNFLKLERIRLYAQVSNVFTLTKYPGLDPEVRSIRDGRSSDINKGIDFGSYGMPRQFLLGLNVSF